MQNLDSRHPWKTEVLSYLVRCLLSGAAGDERFTLEGPGLTVDFVVLVVDDGVDDIRLMLDTACALHCTMG